MCEAYTDAETTRRLQAIGGESSNGRGSGDPAVRTKRGVTVARSITIMTEDIREAAEDGRRSGILTSAHRQIKASV